MSALNPEKYFIPIVGRLNKNYGHIQMDMPVFSYSSLTAFFYSIAILIDYLPDIVLTLSGL